MIRLSPTSGLNLFAECPKCFWLHYNKKVHRPRGIFPSLPGGMDLAIKDYMDSYRPNKMPPELKGQIGKAKLMPDKKLLDKWRNWHTGLEYIDKKMNAKLFGALDDCLMENDYYIPLDYKTRGFPPKEGDSERYYQTQLDAYNLLLFENGFLVKDYAYLLYYYPKEVEKNGEVDFYTKVVKVQTDLKRAKKTFQEAVECLNGPMPEKHSDCDYCSWLFDRLGFE